MHTKLILSLFILFLKQVITTNSSGLFFDRIFIIVFENEGYSKMRQDPNFNNYASQGLLLGGYRSCQVHPSQPNYICLISGDNFGVTDDDHHDINGTTIVDLLEAQSLTWKAYQENYPGNSTSCFTDDSYPYLRKHNPFISFTNINQNPIRCQNIVEANQLDLDLENPDSLPQYMFYTPNMTNDGHDSSLQDAGIYLSNFMNARLNKFPNRTLIVITFDESDSNEYTIGAILLGSIINPGTVDYNRYSHYSMVRLVEENWQLGSLYRNDATAAIMFPQPLVQNFLINEGEALKFSLYFLLLLLYIIL